MTLSPRFKRGLRYLAPNCITALNLVFGMLALMAAYEGRFVDSAWLIIYSVLTDRLDGFVARLVRGTSELGVQLDSFCRLFELWGCASVFVFLRIYKSADASLCRRWWSVPIDGDVRLLGVGGDFSLGPLQHHHG